MYSDEYPFDSDRRFEIINQNIHIWFFYSINFPSFSDMVFEYKTIYQEFIDNNDFKDQEWFSATSKREIFDLFLAKDVIVYLVEKDRIENGKAIMIRVYPDKQVVE